MRIDEVTTAAQALWEAASRCPDRPCVTDLDDPAGATTSRYGELVERVAAVGGGFRAAGLGPGDRVALLLPNSLGYVEAYLGALAAGLVVVPLNVRLVMEDYDHMLRDSGSRVLVTTTEFQQRMPSLGAVPGVTVVLADAGGLDGLAAQGPALSAPVARAGADPASLMYTSGTTGLPKAVVLTHDSWRSVAATAADVLGFSDGEVTLHVAPLTHGAGFLFLPTLQHAGHNLLCRSYDPAGTLRAIDELGVNVMFLVPSMIRMLLDVLPDGWTPPESLRHLYYAGSPIAADTLREAVQAFPGRMVQSFAQMESPMFFTVLDAEDHRRALEDPSSPLVRSAGRVLPAVELRIVDDSGAELPRGESGEVVARAPQTMAGYWNRPEATAAALSDGWLHTGDIGYLDDDEHLYIVDRKKDMIVTGGSNVYAREVEDVLLGLDGVAEAAVIGLPDRIWGEAVTAVLVADEGRVPRDGGDDAVIAACRSAMAGYRVPKRVIWVDRLPRNAYGKVLKRELRDRFAG
jgi:acyl-CoA synthetase (AMP-forming)/AMP-acid ligase II